MKKKVNKFRSLDFKNNKFTTILYFLLRLLVLIILIYSIVIGKYENAFTCLLVLILLIMPFILEEKLKIQFSGSLEVAMLLFVFVAEIIGEVNAGYQNIPNLDTVMHTLNGFIMGAVGFSLVNMANNNEKFDINMEMFFDEGEKQLGLKFVPTEADSLNCNMSMIAKYDYDEEGFMVQKNICIYRRVTGVYGGCLVQLKDVDGNELARLGRIR